MLPDEAGNYLGLQAIFEGFGTDIIKSTAVACVKFSVTIGEP